MAAACRPAGGRGVEAARRTGPGPVLLTERSLEPRKLEGNVVVYVPFAPVSERAQFGVRYGGILQCVDQPS